MAVDRDKVARNALRFIQKGQFQRAIDEYKKVLAADPRDIRTRLKLIDLYGRAGKKKDAIDECLQVTEVYADQGFYLKAIAVYKQALRIDPENPHLCRFMGEMYLKQGLVGDALTAFKAAVDLLRRQGQHSEAEDLLVRMEEMAPENAAIKIHLAELYLGEGRYPDFEQELSKLILQLRGEGRTRKLLQAVESFYERSHHHPSVLTRLAQLYADLGEEEKALEVVREGLARDPADRGLRLLALRAQVLLGQLAEARRIAQDLHEEDPDDLFILEQLASIALARGERTELAHSYKAMAHAYARRGLQQKEEDCYRKVLELFPDDAETLISLGGPRQEPPTPPRPPRKAAASSPPGETAVVEEEPDRGVREGLVEAELYLKYGMEEKAAEKLAQLIELAPRDIRIRQSLRDLAQRRGDRSGWAREQLQIAELFLREKRENEALRAYEAILEVDPANEGALQGVRYLRPERLPEEPTDSAIDLDGSTVEFVTVDGTEQVVRPRAIQPEPDEAPGLRAALEEIDFYEAQGMNDEAASALRRLQESHPESPEVADRLGRRVGHDGPDETESPFVDLQGEVLDAAGVKGFRDFEVSELDDIVREFKSGIAEKVDEADYETHYNLGVAYREMELLEDAAQEFRLAARSPEKARDAYTSLALVFRDLERPEDADAALRMALAVPMNTAKDRAAILYELGALAEEGGDWERALELFEETASENPGERGVQERIRRLRSRVPR